MEHNLRNWVQELNGNILYWLCYDKKWDQVREFLDSDSNNNKDKKLLEVVRYQQEGGDGWTCLHYACCNQPPADIIKSLMDIGGKELVMMITTSDKNTALHYVCSHGASFDVIKMLLFFGAAGKNT